MDRHNNHPTLANPATDLPANAQVPLNHCSLPASIIGSLVFQQHPVALQIDGVHELHKRLFTELDCISEQKQRALYFMDYMSVQFRLHHPEDTGLDMEAEKGRQRDKADYLRLLRGWLFDPNGREAAVMKSWVESRFGLLARYHNGLLYKDFKSEATSEKYAAYLQSRAQGLYATNALESQLDLVYSYCQFELARTYQQDQHLHLFRGINRLHEYEVLQRTDKFHAVLLLNNLNSFTRNRERADEFGDQILEIDACWQKVLFYSDLLPGLFIGEEEVIVIGGVHEVAISR